MRHTINNKEEIERFLEEFSGQEIKDLFFGSVIGKSKNLENKILLFQSEKGKILLHFNHVMDRFENRTDLKSIFLLYGNTLENDIRLRAFAEQETMIKDLEEFFKEEDNQCFSDYVISEIYNHLDKIDEKHKEKLFALSPEELYCYLEKNEMDIGYIRKIFVDDKKVYASLLIHKLLNDETIFLSSAKCEELYDRVIRGFLKRCGVKSFDEIDFEHFIYRYLLLIKDSKYTVSEIRKIIKLSNELADESLENIFKKLDDEKIEREFNYVKESADHYLRRLNMK